MSECAQCEALQVAALNASRRYHALLGELEAAHICRKTHAIFSIKQEASEALGNRNDAIKVRSEHESAHTQITTPTAKAGTAGR